MVSFTLKRSDFINQKNLGTTRINHQINGLNLDHMKILINRFNQEYKWENMFNIDDVFDRLEKNHTLFILVLENNPIGYVWFREINNQTVFLYNLYVTKQIKRPRNSPIWFVNESCSEMLKTYHVIECECEEWNTHAQNVFISNNFKSSN